MGTGAADTLLRVRQRRKSDVSRAFLVAILVVGVGAILGVICVDGSSMNCVMNSKERKKKEDKGG